MGILKKSKPQKEISCLGVAVDDFFIRVAEVKKDKKGFSLQNYGEILHFGGDLKENFSFLINEMEVKSKDVFFCLKNSAFSFFIFQTVFLPTKDISEQIKEKVRELFSLEPEKVIFDWQIVEGKITQKRKDKVKILLVGIQKDFFEKWKEMAESLNFNFLGLEPKIFSQLRALKESEKNFILVDFEECEGSINFVEEKNLKLNKNINLLSKPLSFQLSEISNFDVIFFEKIKVFSGILKGLENGEKISEILLPFLEKIVSETETVVKNLFRERKKIEKIILSGGGLKIPGVKKYFERFFNLEIKEITSDVLFPKEISEISKEILETFLAAIGAAKKGIEKEKNYGRE
jgi:Tfp pilus assembly PilM family ATPase